MEQDRIDELNVEDRVDNSLWSDWFGDNRLELMEEYIEMYCSDDFRKFAKDRFNERGE